MANLGNFIYDISGFRVRTGYARNHFSYSGCEELSETTATTSLGLLLAAKDDMGNCAQGEDFVTEMPDTVPVSAEHEDPFSFFTENVAEQTEEEPQEEEVQHIEEVETDSAADETPQEEPAKEEPVKEDTVQRTLFRDDEIEKVPRKPKPKKDRFIKVIWTKVKESTESLYNIVNQDIDKEKI